MPIEERPFRGFGPPIHTMEGVRRLIRGVARGESKYASLHDWILDNGGNGREKRGMLANAGWLKAEMQIEWEDRNPPLPARLKGTKQFVWFSPDQLESVQKGSGGTSIAQGAPRISLLFSHQFRPTRIEEVFSLISQVGKQRYWSVVSESHFVHGKTRAMKKALRAAGWRRVKINLARLRGGRIVGKRKKAFWLSPYKKKTL